MNRTNSNLTFQSAIKRSFDYVMALAGLIVLFPVMVVITIAIKLDSKGPVLYRHRRIGKNGVPFNMYKFRSMHSGNDNADYLSYLRQLIESEKNDPEKALPYRKLNDDPRITRVGHFLRRYYLDELPQLFNILTGSMSLVGPRPHVQLEVDHYTPDQRRRLSVAPGLTGLWQATSKTECSFSELIDLDLKYIDTWSLWLDIKIIFKTLSVISRGGERFWKKVTRRVPGKVAAQAEQSPRI